jgi:hypothetical protein
MQRGNSFPLFNTVSSLTAIILLYCTILPTDIFMFQIHQIYQRWYHWRSQLLAHAMKIYFHWRYGICIMQGMLSFSKSEYPKNVFTVWDESNISYSHAQFYLRLKSIIFIYNWINRAVCVLSEGPFAGSP